MSNGQLSCSSSSTLTCLECLWCTLTISRQVNGMERHASDVTIVSFKRALIRSARQWPAGYEAVACRPPSIPLLYKPLNPVHLLTMHSCLSIPIATRPELAANYICSSAPQATASSPGTHTIQANVKRGGAGGHGPLASSPAAACTSQRY